MASANEQDARSSPGPDDSVHEAASAHGPSVNAEERHRLAECCAFFKAVHYREATPGAIRQQDIEAAERQIDAVLRHCDESKPADPASE
jgi:hypothetical protein